MLDTMNRRDVVKRGIAYSTGILAVGSSASNIAAADSSDPDILRSSSETESGSGDDWEATLSAVVTGPQNTTEQTNEVGISWSFEIDDDAPYRTYYATYPTIYFDIDNDNNPAKSNVSHNLYKYSDFRSGEDLENLSQVLKFGFNVLWDNYAMGPSPADLLESLNDAGSEEPDDRTEGFEEKYADNVISKSGSGGVKFNINHGVNGSRPPGPYVCNVSIESDIYYRHPSSEVGLVGPLDTINGDASFNIYQQIDI